MTAAQYILIIIFALQALGCSQSKNETGTSKEYIPLSEGNTWEYIKEGTDSLAYRVEVLSVKKEGSDIIAEFNMLPYFYLNSSKQTLRVKPDGEMIMSAGESESINFFPSEKNLKKDYTWSAGGWHAVIAGTNQSVSAGGRQYSNCVHINYTLSITFNAEIWVSPGAGIVKWGFNRTNPPSVKFDYYTAKNVIIK